MHDDIVNQILSILNITLIYKNKNKKYISYTNINQVKSGLD